MRAVAVFPEERKVRLVDHPEPRREQPSDVLARVLEVGICRTDREIARFEYGFRRRGRITSCWGTSRWSRSSRSALRTAWLLPGAGRALSMQDGGITRLDRGGIS